MKNNLIRIPLTILLVWLGWLGLKQAGSGFLDRRDWSDDYLRKTARIVDSKRETSLGANSRSTTYYCYLTVEYEFEGKVYRDEAAWLSLPPARSYPEEDCGKSRYGEQVPVWIGKSGNDPMLLQPENRSARPMTLVFNLIQGLFFFGLAGLLWRRRRKKE